MPVWIRPCTLFHWASETTGPITTPSEVGSPTVIAPAAAAAAAAASSIFSAGTRMRVPALQLCPVFMHIPKKSRPTVSPTSAEGRTMLADLPPSSCATRLTVGAAFLATSTPARVEPVKLIMSTSGCEERWAPTVGPSPLTRLNTPAGTPASWSTSAKRSALRGAISEGLSTMVHPVAIAGATLQAIWLSGQFQGVIIPTTPAGSLTSRKFSCCSSNS